MTPDDKKAGILDHISRPGLPWRDEPMTECGKRQDAVRQIITPGQYADRLRAWGQRRTAFTVCQTCASRASYSHPWEIDPVGVIERETGRVRDLSTYAQPAGNPGSERARFTAELRALAALVAAHRDEFDSYLTGLADTTDLASRRAAKRRQA